MTDADLDLATRSILAAFEVGGIDAARKRFRDELNWWLLRAFADRALAADDGPGELSILDTGD